MFKKAKIYSLLGIIVASAAVGLFGFLQPVNAQEANSNTASWVDIEGGEQTLLYDRVGYSYVGALNDDSSQFYWRVNNGFSNGDDLFFTNEEMQREGKIRVFHAIETRTNDVTGIIYFRTAEDGNGLPDGITDRSIDARYVKCSGSGSFIVCDGPKVAITITGTATDDEVDEAEELGGTITDDEPEPSSTSCQIKGVGWILCPLVIFLAEVTDASYAILDKTLLRIEPMALPGSSGNEAGMQLYNSWKSMRDFANIIFIIGFLLIVFSQITSIGISNYGIKRLLPKIIIAAILVNLSYFICVIAVDLSNILGNALRGVLSGVASGPTDGGPFSFAITTDADGDRRFISSWYDLVQLIIGGAGAGLAIAGTGLLIYALVPVLLPLIISAAVAVFTVVVALTFRQAFVVILVVLSPLAFVALLLPNTESYFQRWRSLFFAMLLVYPVVSVVFGASALASRILMATGDFPTQIVGAAVTVIPLFITPVIMKVSGGLLNRFVGFVNDPSKGWVDNKRNALKEQGDIIAANRKARGITRTGNWVSSSRGSRVFGGANSRRRRVASIFTGYGEKTRKDNLDAAESDTERAYLGTQGGQEARNAAKNAQVNLQNAQINTETVRLTSTEGVDLQADATLAERRKQIAEDRAQTAAISAIPAALEAQAQIAATDKKTAEHDSKASGLAEVVSSTAGQVALNRLKDAENREQAEENTAKAVGLTGASRDIAAQAENAALGAKIAEDNLAGEVAPLVSQTARVMGKSADIAKETAVKEAETAATNTFNSSIAGRDALGNAKNAELLEGIANNDSKAIGIARANEEFKVQAETSSEALTTLTNRDKQTYAEISAQGAGGVSRSLGVSDATARAAQQTSQESKAVSNAVSDAQYEGNIAYAKEMGRTGSPLPGIAGGRIDNAKGAESAKKAAKAVENRAFDEKVRSYQDTMSSYTATRLSREMENDSLPIEQRAAAAGKFATNGGAEDIMNAWNQLHDMRATIMSNRRSGVISEAEARDQYSKLQAIQQQFAADVGKSGKLPSSIVTGQALGQMARGEGAPKIEREIIRKYTAGDFSGEILAGVHPKQLARVAQAFTGEKLSNPSFTASAQFKELQADLLAHEAAATASGKGLTQEHKRLFDYIRSL